MKKICCLLLCAIPIVVFGKDTIGIRNITNAYKVKSESYTHNSDSIFILNGNWKEESEKYLYNVQFDVFKKVNSEKKNDFFYLGENCYLGIVFSRFQITLGRKLFENSSKNLKSYKDGSEGIGVETQITKNFKLKFQFVDYYRAYPLLEKNFMINPEVEKTNNGNRIRHGFSVDYETETFYASLFIKYLNLKNWGLLSKDDPYLKDSGDGDYIYHTGVSLRKTIFNLSLGMDAILSRGLDKATYNPYRQENSIPISGELVTLSLDFEYKFFSTHFHVFLPDRDKRNKEGELLETGFIGMGSYPGNSFLISQYLNYYPTGWITQNGMEKQEAIYLGRNNSLWAYMEMSFVIKQFQLTLKYDYFIPYKVSDSSTGTISVKREDFEKFFVAEETIALRYGDKGAYFLEVQASRMISTSEKPIVGNHALVQGGIWF
ncbi:MAG: hypothetical protein H7A23_24515 [Leptospiraceae bacterium]|nr:hypothetical protein [Leptospiraceae bacterium]MCP5497729.1 hypothetical protein [Leptospiraceae bacterium]